MAFAMLASGRIAKQTAAARAVAEQAIEDRVANYVKAGKLPVIAVSINLGGGEHCHYKTPCTYAVMASINHGSVGVGASVRVWKGVRVGAYQRLPSVRDMQMLREDAGTLYLTSKRVVFVGETTSQSFNWTRILQVSGFNDGVRYEISNHRPIQFRTGDREAALLSLVLTKAVSLSDEATDESAANVQ